MTCNYNAEDKNVMKVSAQAKNKSRLQELIDFAKISGFKKIGVANCKGVQELADRFIALLREQGLEVVSVNCKESGLDGCEIFLNEQGTDFNVNFGLCLGHGLLFQKYSKVPVTTFLVKDFAHNHNIVESLMA